MDPISNLIQRFEKWAGLISSGPAVMRRTRTYVLNAAVAANTTKQFPLYIDTGADFEWINRIASNNDTAGGVLNFRIGLQDGASGRQLILCNPPAGSTITPDTTAALNYFGTAQLPMHMPQPYVFKRGSTVWVTIANQSSHTNTIEIVFDGFDLVPADNITQGSSGQIVQAGAAAAAG